MMYNLGMVIPDNEYRNFFEACKNHVGLNDVRTVSNRIFECFENLFDRDGFGWFEGFMGYGGGKW